MMTTGIFNFAEAKCGGGCGDGSRFGVPLNWPLQLRMVPLNADIYNNADLLIAADCSCYMHTGFHRDFINGAVVFITCPELDGVDHSIRLTELFRQNDFRSVTVAVMDTPCCGGLESAVKKAIADSGRIIPCKVITISTESNAK